MPLWSHHSILPSDVTWLPKWSGKPRTLPMLTPVARSKNLQRNLSRKRGNVIGIVSAKLRAPITADRKFEDVVKSAQDAAVLVLVY